MGNETFRYFFFLFFVLCTSATRSPVDEKITTSRLIVESKPNAYRLLARNQCRSDQSLLPKKKREQNQTVQINRPRDRAVGFSLHGVKKKKKDRKAQVGDERDTDFE